MEQQTLRHLVLKVVIYITILFIISMPLLIRHLWQLKFTVFQHRCLIHLVLLWWNGKSAYVWQCDWNLVVNVPLRNQIYWNKQNKPLKQINFWYYLHLNPFTPWFLTYLDGLYKWFNPLKSPGQLKLDLKKAFKGPWNIPWYLWIYEINKLYLFMI
jgi:hypothetical protein